MSKPTIWQALLGKPSQSYSFPPDKEYFSSKQDMVRIATDVHNQPSSGNSAYVRGDNLAQSLMPTNTRAVQSDRRNKYNDSIDDDFTSVAAPVLRLTELYEEEDEGNMSDSEDDLFFTPNTSPRVSVASSNRSGGSNRLVGRRALGSSRPSSQRSSKAGMNKAYTNGNAGVQSNGDSRTSMKDVDSTTDKTQAHTEINPIPIASNSAGERDPHQPTANKTHTSTSSLSSASLPGNSLFNSSMSDSTRTSSPAYLENDSRATGSDHVPKQGMPDTPLLPSQASATTSSKRKPLPTPSIMTHAYSNGGTNSAPPRKSNSILKAMSKANPSIMMNMSALLEEDEEITSGSMNYQTYTNGSHPRSSVILVQPENSTTSSKFTSTLDDSTRSTSRRSSMGDTGRSANNSTSSKSRVTIISGDANNKHRGILRHRRSRSHDDLKSSSKSDGRSRATSTLASLPMPNGELPSHGTPGYSSLVLPRAPPPVSLNPRTHVPKIEPSVDGRIDLTRSGIAQTTMATVEVVHGLGASTKAGKGLLGVLGKRVNLGRRKTVSGRGSDPSRARSEDNDTLGGGPHRPLGFTSYRKPPNYVPSSSVLVQVWAVGVDGIDARLVGLRQGSSKQADNSFSHKTNSTSENSRSGSLRWKFARAVVTTDHDAQQPQVGYIPGRSFVGRVLECGWEVSEGVVRKGDWIVGLLDTRKAGALSEFIVADKRRIHRVPLPKMNDLSPKALGKQPQRSNSVNRMPVWGLTMEELALLPLCGVPAYRAVRTFTYAFSSSTTRNFEDITTGGSARVMSNSMNPQLDAETGRARRALVLRGHDGVGSMAARMLIARGWDVSIHAPCNYPAQSDEAEAYMSAIENRARSWGCDEVIFDDGLETGGDEGRGAVVRVMERLLSEGDVVDAVLDTVGGKEVWEVAERLLKSSGSGFLPESRSPGNGSANPISKRSIKGVAQFTTLVGDSPGRVLPSAGDLFKAGVRSLRVGGRVGGSTDSPNAAVRAGGGSGREKKVGYAWISSAQDVDWEGQDISESIGAVLRLALEGVAKPWVDTQNRGHKVVPFEKAPEVFVDDGPLSHGSTIVVKIAG